MQGSGSNLSLNKIPDIRVRVDLRGMVIGWLVALAQFSEHAWLVSLFFILSTLTQCKLHTLLRGQGELFLEQCMAALR